MAFEAGPLLLESVVDLGLSNAALAGVFAPSNESRRLFTGVTNQFLDQAETYHKKYFDISYASYLLNSAFTSVPTSTEPQLILDVGSGSGPSVLALLERFPQATVLATDVSPQLLALLRGALNTGPNSERCQCLCIDLNEGWFKPRTFDLAVGTAILPHLFDPEKLIAQIFTSVRPGGAVLFFEPFEPGYAVLALLYRLILAHANYLNPLPANISDLFQKKIGQIHLMKCEAKDADKFADVDDKWMFTREYFEGIGRKIGARQTIIQPINHSANPFSAQVQTALRLGLGLSPEALPSWAWQLIAEYEESIVSV